jgi:hypothetical protein
MVQNRLYKYDLRKQADVCIGINVLATDVVIIQTKIMTLARITNGPIKVIGNLLTRE